MKDTAEVLGRLLRRVGREAARHERMCESMRERGATVSMERAFGEANVLRMVQGFIRDEMKKVKP